jgi:hypothetical protein
VEFKLEFKKGNYMASMSEIPMEIPAQFRDQIPLESSDTSDHIKFTNLVLDLIKQISQEGVSKAVPKKKYTKGPTKRTREGESVKEESKIELSTILQLAKIASSRNTAKITHERVEEDQPMDPKEAEGRLKGQLSMLKALEKKEQKVRASAARSRKMAEPESKTREEMRSEILASQEENSVIGLKDATEKMDRAFRSLEPFTIEGLKEKIEQDQGIKNKDQITSALSRTLQNAHNTLSGFCAEYYRATGLANTMKSPYGDKIRELVADIDTKVGKLSLVEAYMKSLVDFDKALERKRQVETFFSHRPVHGLEELKSSPDINTQALLAGQQKQMEFQEAQAEETRRELARGRGFSISAFMDNW